MARWSLVWLAVLAVSAPAAAQDPPGPPGPYIVDLRGSTIGLPKGAAFYPAVSSTAIVPARGFGVDAGAHVYFATWRAARIGLGASALYARGTALDVIATLGVLAPQLSLNFGTANGWSYLSAGVGGVQFKSRRVREPTSAGTDEGSDDSDEDDGDDGEDEDADVDFGPDTAQLTVRSINFGGGARWFVKRRLAVGFDIRFHKLAGGTTGTGVATPGATLVAASAGFSFR